MVKSLILQAENAGIVHDTDGKSGLFLAVQKNNVKIVNALLEANIFDSKDCDEVLNVAVENDSWEVVDLLLVHFNLITAAGKVLNLAAKKGNVDLAKALLCKYSCVNFAEDGNRNTALHIAVKRNDINFATMLLECCTADNQTNSNAFNALQESALSIAVSMKNVAMSSLLLRNGAMLNLPNMNHDYPLGTAIEYEHLEMIMLLLQKGAITTQYKKLVRILVRRNQLDGILLLLEQQKVDINAAIEDKETLLSIAFELQHYDIAKALIQCCDVNEDLTRKFVEVAGVVGDVCLDLIKVMVGCRHISINDCGANKRPALIHAAQSANLGIVEYLLKQPGIDVNVTEKRGGKTALMVAVERNSVELVSMLLNAPALDIDAVDNESNSAAHYAAGGCRANGILKLILERGAKTMHFNKHNMTPLMIAVKHNNVAKVAILIVNMTDRRKTFDGRKVQSALMLACKSGHSKIVEIFHSHGARLDVTDSDTGDTPLLAAIRGNKVETARVLLKHGANAHALDKDGKATLKIAIETNNMEIIGAVLDSQHVLSPKCTENAILGCIASSTWHIARSLLSRVVEIDAPVGKIRAPLLAHAALDNHVAFMKTLIDHGANVDAVAEDGSTSLGMAVRNGHGPAVTLLINYKANIRHQNKCGESIIISATMSGDSAVEMADILLKAGLTAEDLNVVDKTNLSPLMKAAASHNLALASMLLRHGANASLDNKNDILTCAIGSRDAAMVELLLPHVNVNAFDKFGETPLTSAVACGSLDIAALVMKHNPYIHKRNKAGRTPLVTAVAKGNIAFIKDIYVTNLNKPINQFSRLDSTMDETEPAIVVAVKNRALQMIEILLQIGAARNGETPLLLAIRLEFVDVALKLIDHAADVNVTNNNGETPLICAVSLKDCSLINALLNSGADANAKDKKSETAFDRAIRCECEALVSLIGLRSKVSAPTYHPNSNNQKRAGGNGVLARPSCSPRMLMILTQAPFSYMQCLIEQDLMEYLLDCVKDYEALLQDCPVTPHPFQTKSASGDMLLHYALRQGEMDKAALILDIYPPACSQTGRFGRYPIDILLERLSSDDRCEHVSLLARIAGSTVDELKSDSVNYTIDDLKMMQIAFAREKEVSTKPVHLHLCGDGYAGKSTLQKALLAGFSSTIFSLAKNVTKVRFSDRTIGQVQTTWKLKRRKYIIHDYGGQKEFHVNHPQFLSVDGSVYVIVLPLYNVQDNEKYEHNYIADRYRYWLRFLNVVAKSDSPVITVINYHKSVTPDEVTAIEELLHNKLNEWMPQSEESKDSDWRPYGSRLLLCTQMHTFKVKKIEKAKLLTELIDKAVQKLTILPVETSKLLHAVLSNKREAWRMITTRESFHQSYLKPQLKSILTAADSQLWRRLKERIHENEFSMHGGARSKLLMVYDDILLRQLESMGEIVVVCLHNNNERDCKDCIVTNTQWLSEKLLGNLVEKQRTTTSHEGLLTLPDIKEQLDQMRKIKNTGKLRVSNDDESISEEVVAQLLETIGLCIPYTEPNSHINKLWFPVFATKVAPPEVFIPQRPGIGSFGRYIRRLFQLSGQEYEIFPPGYFSRLFVYVAGILRGKDDMQIYENGIALSWTNNKTKIRILVYKHDNRDETVAFEVVITTESECLNKNNVTSAWHVFSTICNKIRDGSFHGANSWCKLNIIEKCYNCNGDNDGALIVLCDVEQQLNSDDEMERNRGIRSYYGIDQHGNMYMEVDPNQKSSFRKSTSVIQRSYSIKASLQELHIKMEKFFDSMQHTSKQQLNDAQTESRDILDEVKNLLAEFKVKGIAASTVVNIENNICSMINNGGSANIAVLGDSSNNLDTAKYKALQIVAQELQSLLPTDVTVGRETTKIGDTLYSEGDGKNDD